MSFKRVKEHWGKKENKEEYNLCILSFILSRASCRNVSKVLINSHSRAIVLDLANCSMQFCPANWKISYSHSFN